MLGGMLAEHFHWSLIFWVNVPVGLLAALMAHNSLKRLPRHDRRHKLDLLGAGLMMAAAIPLLLALTWGGTRYPGCRRRCRAGRAAPLLSLLFGWRLAQAPEPFLPLYRARQSGDAHGQRLTAFSHGRGGRAHHLRAAVFRGGAQVSQRANPASRSFPSW